MHEVVIVICTVDEKLASYEALLLQNKVASIISEKNINQAEGAIKIFNPHKSNQQFLISPFVERYFLRNFYECYLQKTLAKLSDPLRLTCANILRDTLASCLRKPPNNKQKISPSLGWAFTLGEQK